MGISQETSWRSAVQAHFCKRDRAKQAARSVQEGEGIPGGEGGLLHLLLTVGRFFGDGAPAETRCVSWAEAAISKVNRRPPKPQHRRALAQHAADVSENAGGEKQMPRSRSLIGDPNDRTARPHRKRRDDDTHGRARCGLGTAATLVSARALELGLRQASHA